MIERMEHRGVLIGECSLPGEGKPAVFPGHVNGMQVRADRFLLLYTTRSYRGIDDNRSVVWQLRADGYDGRLVREGCFAATQEDWEPLGDGRRCVRAHLHPVGFGVAKDAGGGRQAGVFAVLWHRMARHIDPATGFMLKAKESAAWLERSLSAGEWVQFRLNDAGDDLEIIQPVQMLRQHGFAEGDAFCDAPVHSMMQTFVMPAALDDSSRSWVMCNSFDDGAIAPMRFAFDDASGRYRWDATGPMLRAPGDRLIETSVLRYRDSWVVSARTHSSFTGAGSGGGPVAWFRSDDLFAAGATGPLLPGRPLTKAPLTAYTCPDGVVRLITGDGTESPHGKARDPLYCWDIDPDRGFAVTGRWTVFDSVAAGMTFATGAVVDQGKLLMSANGGEMVLAHRVRPGGIFDPQRAGMAVTEAEQRMAGIYYAVVGLG